MPDRGLMELAAIPEGVFAAESPLVLAQARWIQVTFEVQREAALSFMPADVGRPIPPYGRLLVAESRAGGLAILSVGGRYRMLPRNVVVAVIADEPLFRDARAAFGSVAPGTVHITRDGAAVTATVDTAEGHAATVVVPSIYAIEPSMLRWDPFVAAIRQGGSATIAELALQPDTQSAFLSKGAAVELGATLPAAHAWRKLRSLGTISACYLEGTLTFGAPQIQQTWS